MVEVTRTVLGGVIDAATEDEGGSVLVVAVVIVAVICVVAIAVFLYFKVRKVSGHGK
jgi:hypothetical protein